MTANYTTEELETSKKIMGVLNDHLKDNRVYFKEVTTSKNGSSSKGIYYFEDGIKVNRTYAFDKYEKLLNDLKSVDKLLRKTELSSLYRNLPAKTKVMFRFQKDNPLQRKVYTIEDLIEDIKQDLQERFDEKENSNNSMISFESLIKFEQQEDEINSFVDTTEVSTDNTASYCFYTGDRDLIDCLVAALDKPLNTLHIHYKDNSLSLEALPNFPKYNIKLCTKSHITLSPAYEKIKNTFNEALTQRHQCYTNIGTLDDRILYLSIGGFSDASWPEDSTTHNSSKFRVIYTKTTSILISDGLSDVYKSNFKENSKYNGIGAEFYIEFQGIIPFDVIKNHFCVALLNSVTQIALRHGDFKALMLKYSTTTIEFKKENINLWSVRSCDDSADSHDISTFFKEEQYSKANRFGAFLGMESENVPKKSAMNLEEILLINVKPFSEELLFEELVGENPSEQEKARKRILAHFKTQQEGNLIPLTYLSEYVDKTSSNSGIVEAEIFPTSLLS